MDSATLGAAVAIAKKNAVDPAVIEGAVADWLDDHPEATTTVQDGSITKAKLDSNLQGTVNDVGELKSALNQKPETSKTSLNSPYFVNTGFIRYSDGKLNNAADKSWMHTNLIKVAGSGDITYKVQGSGDDALATIAAYDSDFNYLQSYSRYTNDGTVHVESPVAYVRFCGSTSYIKAGNATMSISGTNFVLLGVHDAISSLHDDISSLHDDISGLHEDTLCVLNNNNNNISALFPDRKGYIAFSNGSISSSPQETMHTYSKLFYVTEGTVLTFAKALTETTGTVALIAAYDEDGNYIKTASVNSSVITYTVPSGVALIRISGLKSQLANIVLSYTGSVSIEASDGFIFLNDAVSDLNDAVSDLQDAISVSILVDDVFKSGLFNVTGGYISPTGGYSNNPADLNWACIVDYVRVEPNSSYEYYAYTQDGALSAIAFYDADKVWISSETVSSVKTSGTVPSNAVYARFSAGRGILTTSDRYVKIKVYRPVSDIVDDVMSDVEDLQTEQEEIRSMIDNIDELIDSSRIDGFAKEVNHIINYGQSLSQGDWSTYVISDAPRTNGNALMFHGTMRVWEYRGNDPYASLDPAVENVFRYREGETVVGANVRAETECYGTADYLLKLVETENADKQNALTAYGHAFKVLVSAPGMGGMTIEALGNKTGIYYQRLLEDVRQGKLLSNASGMSYVCRAVTWLQGESNCSSKTSYESYYAQMKAMFENLNADIKAITGQSDDVHFFIYQTMCYDWYYQSYTWPYVPLAQYQIAQDLPYVHMVGPIYAIPLWRDYCHLSPEGSKLYGGYIARAYKRTLMDNEPWNCIHPIAFSTFKKGTNEWCIDVKFSVPAEPLVIDTDYTITNDSTAHAWRKLPVRTGNGFQLRDKGDLEQNSYNDIITNVAVIAPDTVRITTNANPVGMVLTYDINGLSTDRPDMACGNLRDSATETYSFADYDGTVRTHHMYNWCPLFIHELS